MASDILGLFASPQQYEQQRQAAMEAQALRMAELNPMQQGQYGIALGAQQLGRAIGGALGGVDPQLQKITQRQQLLGMIDPSNPDSYAQAIQAALQTGDQEAAFLLRNEMMRVQEQASIAEGRRFEREKFLIDRGEGIRARNLQADALEKAKLLVREDGTVDQTVYADLINNYGQVGATVVKQRLDSMQGVKSMQAQQLAQGLFNPDGTPNLSIVAELRQTPEGRKILEENTPKTISVKGDETIMTVPVLGQTPKVIQQGQKVEPFTGTMANAANFLYQTTDPKKIFATHGQKGLDAVDRKAEEMSTKEAIAKAPKIVVDLNDPTAVAKASLDVMGKWQDFLKSAGDVETASRFKALQSSVSLAQGGNTSADGATIFNIGKIYDPSGAVQEGDKDTILGNRAIPAKIQALAQRVFQGGSLTPKERENLLEVGTQLIKGKEEELQKYRVQYIRKNKALGGLEEDILNPYDGLIKSSPQSSVSQIPTDREVKPQVIKQPPVKQDQSSQQKGKVVKKWSDLK